MNNKITFPELVDRIAELTNTSKRVSELFLKELFGVVKERLEQGESVKIKNLGTFKVTEIAARKSVNVNTGEEMEIPSHRKVSFTPDKSLAEAVNSPFEGFETIVLDDEISEEELEVRSEELGVRSEELPPVFVEKEVEISVEKDEQETESEPEQATVTSEEPTEEASEEPDNSIQEETAVTEIPEYKEEKILEEESEEDDDFDEEIKTEKRKSFIWGFIGGVVTFILVGLISIAVCDSCFGDFVPFAEQKVVTAVESETGNVADTVALIPDTVETKNIEPVKEVPEIVTDTVRVNYYLTKMSRKYYGRYEFWVYIYEENKDKIKNPNKVSPGLVVVIPPASKYGIDKNDEESVNKAKKLAEKLK